MKRSLLLLLGCFVIVAAAGQSAKKKFEKAVELYEEEKYDSALVIFQQIYKKGNGDPSMLAKAHYNIAEIYFEKKDSVNAKKVFKEVINAGYDEMDRGGVGGGIMADPYSMYGNNSCTQLAEIALAEKNYSDALKYIELTATAFPYRHFCGNAFEANAIYRAYTLGRCYAGMGDPMKAIEVMLPQLMNTQYANNTHLVDTLCALIKQTYSPDMIRVELTKAISKIALKKVKQWEDYRTTIFDVEVPVNSSFEYKGLWSDLRKFTQLQQHVLGFKNSLFYRTLMGTSATMDFN